MNIKRFILIIVLTLFMSGCSVNTEEYYRGKAELEQYELEVDMLQYDINWINQFDRYSKMTYQENYKDEYIFQPITVYAYCELDECEMISVEEYRGD